MAASSRCSVASLTCKARIYSAGFRGFIGRGQVPMTRVSRAAWTTSTVMASSWLMLIAVQRCGEPAHGERGVRIQPAVVGQDALGLFDDDPAGPARAVTGRSPRRFAGRAVLQDADGGDVGECLRGAAVGFGQFPGLAAEQVHRADDPVTVPHRHRVHGPESLAQGQRRELRPRSSTNVTDRCCATLGPPHGRCPSRS
jgi:hypothetical protein